MHGTMETACFDTHSTSPKQEKKRGGGGEGGNYNFQ